MKHISSSIFSLALSGVLIFVMSLSVATPADAAYHQNQNNKNKSSLYYPTQTQEMMHKLHLSASLGGAQEVPAVETSSTGYITLQNFKASQQLSYMLEVYDGEDINAAHLHCGEKGENGPVVVDLFNGPQQDINGMLAQGMINPGDIKVAGENCDPMIKTVDDLVYAIEQGSVYANVHSSQFPNGEIRGQLASSMYGDYGQGTMMHIMDGIELRHLEESPSGTQTFLITIDNEVLRQISMFLHMFAEHLNSLTH